MRRDRIDRNRGRYIDGNHHGISHGAGFGDDPADTGSFAVHLAVTADRRDTGVEAAPNNWRAIDHHPVDVENRCGRRDRIADHQMRARQGENDRTRGWQGRCSWMVIVTGNEGANQDELNGYAASQPGVPRNKERTIMSATAASSITWEQYNETGRRLFAEGDLAGAEDAFVAAIAEAERGGGDPLQLASSLGNLAQLKYQQKDHLRAEELFRRSLELREQSLGSDHPSVLTSINNL